MTVPSTPRRAGPHRGNGVTTSFPFTFKVFAASDVRVIRFFGNTSTWLQLGSQYTVSLNSDQETSPGGSVTIIGAALSNEYSIVVLGALPYDQTTDLPSGGNFTSLVHENAFDRMVMQLQQLAEESSRQLAVREDVVGVDLRIPTPEAGKLIGWNNGGTGLRNIGGDELINVAGFAAWRSQKFNGGGTSFVLSEVPGTVENLMVVVDGLVLTKDEDYTLSGTTLTIPSGTPEGTNNVFLRWGQALPTVDFASEFVSYRDAMSVQDAVDLSLNAMLDPRDKRFAGGAVGDGIHDDTAAIQAALDACANTTWLGSLPASYAKGGGTVVLSPGSYRVTDTLRIGANTRLVGNAPTGGTASAISTQTGAVIVADFGVAAMKWVLSSATFETASGAFASATAQYSGAAFDGGDMTYTHGVRIEGICIDGNGCYGGIRLLASSGFDVHDCFVHDVAVGYYFNTSYGGRYSKLHALFGLYGLLVINSNAIECGHIYMNGVATTWAVNGTTRMVSTFDMSTDAFLPADWKDKKVGAYFSGCLNLNMLAHTCEHTDVGMALIHVSDFTLGGYFEGCGDSDLTCVASSGIATVFANGTTSGIKYHFGTLNSVTLERCSVGGIYCPVAGANTVIVNGGDGAGGGTTDWTWSDSIKFTEQDGMLRVSASGSASAVIGYTTLDEALRRIEVSTKTDWVVKIKDGDTVATAAQRSFTHKKVRFVREANGTRPTFSVGSAGGGFIYRIACSGNVEVSFDQVGITFPAGAADATDNALLAVASACDMRFAFNGGNISLGGGYSVFSVFTGGALNLSASWADCGITAGTNAPVANVTGAAVITSIAAATTVDAGITAIGTNGYEGTVLNSNF